MNEEGFDYKQSKQLTWKVSAEWLNGFSGTFRNGKVDLIYKLDSCCPQKQPQIIFLLSNGSLTLHEGGFKKFPNFQEICFFYQSLSIIK